MDTPNLVEMTVQEGTVGPVCKKYYNQLDHKAETATPQAQVVSIKTKLCPQGEQSWDQRIIIERMVKNERLLFI